MKLSLKSIATAIGGITLAAVVAYAGTAENYKVAQLRLSKPILYRVPTLPDSAERSENKFSSGKLLKSILPDNPGFLQDEKQNWTTVTPDTTGVYHLDIAKEIENDDINTVRIQKVQATIRPDKYFSGKVVVKTPLAGVIYVDGEKVAEKTTQDSVPGTFSGSIEIQPLRDTLVEMHLLSDETTKGDAVAEVMLEPDKGSEDVAIEYNPGKSRFNIMTTVTGPRVSGVDISPDGKYVIVRTSETTDGKRYVHSYDIRECSGGKVVALNFGDGMGWLNYKGSTLYYNRDNADGSYNIETIDFPSMKSTTLAGNLPAESKDYEIAPTGEYIVYQNEVEGEKKSGTMRRMKSQDDRIPGNRDRSYISMIRFDDGIVRPLTYGGASSSVADISKDGKRLLYITSRETPSVYPFYDVSLVELDVNTLKCDTLLLHEPSLNTACYSPDDKEIFVTAGPSFHDGIGANCGEHPIPNDFDVQGYIFNIADRRVRPMTRDFNPSISGMPVWNVADNRIYFKAQKGFDIPVYSLDVKSGKITQLTNDIDYVRDYSVGINEAKYLAYTGMSYGYMGIARMLDLKTGKSTLIADPAGELIASTELGDMDMWSFTAPDGTEIECTVTLPPDFDPAKKYPMIVYYYAGTTPSTHTNHSPYSPPLFASYGYVVFALNPSGTTGYGQEYSARHVNAWGERTADEIIYGTQKFCETHPYIDTDHIGCIGASYGGFMTQLLTTKTDLFAAAVSHAGISNVTSYWGEGYWGYSYNAVAAAKSYPWSNPEIFTRNSSLFNADKIHTPLLLLHGTVDTNVPIGESIQLYNALKILGRDVEFVTVEGENHIIMDFEKRKEWHATIMAWYEKWLKGDSRWWESIYK